MESEASHGPPILPAELVTEILLRLPVKSLLKFRSVLKSWLAVISSSKFIDTHIGISANNKDNNRHRLILTSDQPKHSLKDCYVSSLLYDSVTETLDPEFPWVSTRNSIRFVGSVNELICLFIVKKTYLFEIRQLESTRNCLIFHMLHCVLRTILCMVLDMMRLVMIIR